MRIVTKDINFSESKDTIGKWGEIPKDIAKELNNAVANEKGKLVMVKVVGSIIIITKED